MNAQPAAATAADLANYVDGFRSRLGDFIAATPRLAHARRPRPETPQASRDTLGLSAYVDGVRERVAAFRGGSAGALAAA